MNVAAPRPSGFWIISVLALLWNLVGVAMFFLQFNMSPETLAAIPAEQRALYESTPAWVNGAFAVAVFGGALGSAMLLLKKRLALPLLVLSLLGLLAQAGYTYLMTPAFRVHGASGAIFAVVLVLIALFLVWFARRSLARGWIG